jgi:DNA polymerase bacteriophage-type
MPFKPEHFIDAMVQAARSHLPSDLAGAAKAIGLTQKQAAGKALIKMFADASRPETPQSHPEEWEQFRSYARDDVASMRDVFFATMPLTRREWREYHAVEAINHRGVPVDMAFVRQAVKLSALLTETSNADIARLTEGKVRTVNQSAALLDWIRYSLRALPEVDRILTREVDLVEDEDGEERAVAKMSLGRSHVEELIAYLVRLDDEKGLTDAEWAALQVLEVRLYGASATPKKYKKIEALVEDDGRVRGQYVFGGAAATGRMSGRGFQPQNLARATIGSLLDEAAAIEMVTEQGVTCFADLKKRWGPVGRTLSRLIRPSIVAPPGKTLVWADWSAIEARVLPWIAGSEGGDEFVDVFRQNDLDPSAPDIYRVDAGRLLGKPPEEVTKQERQSHGKIPRLALGFGGGKGALFAMARAYGASFTDGEAQDIVDGWRRENKWAVRLWDQIWEAVLWCMENPGLPREAGRMTYVFDESYLRGTLFGVLPCGRPLLYPGLRWADVEQKNKQTGEVTVRRSLTVRQARARVPLSHLTLTNNAVQGAAASLLRDALVRVERAPLLETVVVTHDEIVCLCDEGRLDDARAALMAIMLDTPAWAEGLPVAAEATSGWWYSKAGES